MVVMFMVSNDERWGNMQIEGGFAQGLGWCTIEEVVWGDSDHKWIRPGHLHTKGPGAFLLPSSLFLWFRPILNNVKTLVQFPHMTVSSCIQ
jgi:xanthine dehydrogenase molybdopterin-binding subunit B